MENNIFRNYSVETIGTLLRSKEDPQYMTLLKEKKSAMKIANEARGIGDDGLKVDVNRQEYAKRKIMLGEVKISSTEDMVYDRLNTYMTVYKGSEKYEKSFESPFKGEQTIALLMLKWIGKKQSIIQDDVLLSNSKLKALGLNITVEQLHKIFINAFDINGYNTEFVKLKLVEGKLLCQTGGRAMKTMYGPGTINLEFSGKTPDIIRRLLEDLNDTLISSKVKTEEKEETQVIDKPEIKEDWINSLDI